MEIAIIMLKIMLRIFIYSYGFIITIFLENELIRLFQKQPSRGVLRKRCSENMQQIYRRAPMRQCDFNKVAKHGCGCSPVNLLHIFRTSFYKEHLWRVRLSKSIQQQREINSNTQQVTKI